MLQTCLCLLYLLMALPAPTQAHNGALAIAVPVEGIKIDGDFSDWPVGMKQYPIAFLTAGDHPRGEEDFKGAFRIGHSARENALYLAVEMQDESAVIDTLNPASWNTQDGCEVYVEVGHQKGEGAPAQWVLWGNTRQVFGAGRAEDARVEVRWGERRYSYEWRIDLDRMSQGQYPLGRVLGVDVVVVDKDGDGSVSWMAWGKGVPNKIDSADRLGDVVVGGKEELGKIQGRVRWEDREEGLRIGRVVVQSLSMDSLWVNLPADSSGGYEVEVPAGAYRIEAGYRRKTAGVEVEVKQGETAPVEEVFFPRPPLVGVEVKAGKGRTTRAGAGSRQGAWHTLGRMDFPFLCGLYFRTSRGIYGWAVRGMAVQRG